MDEKTNSGISSMRDVTRLVSNLRKEQMKKSGELMNETKKKKSNIAIYGFVYWVTTFVLLLLYLVWAFLPEKILREIGIAYYPDKYWALSMPLYAFITIFFLPVFYFSLNLINNCPLDSFQTITDENAMPYEVKENFNNDDLEAISDIPIEMVNQLLYGKYSNKMRSKNEK